MPSTEIDVGGRTFYIAIKELSNRTGYACYFHERGWIGFKTTNKNSTYLERGRVYPWFEKMVEKHLPADKSADEVLDGVVNRLTEKYDDVERE